ncbi:MAG: arylsulfotransferase family protein [Solirubrobacteraceae bacterium]
MRTIEGPKRRACKASTFLAALAPILLAVMALGVQGAQAAPTVAISPLNGTPDASPDAQISFLGVPASEISAISVVGSRSGSHSGKLESYESSPGASFLPSRGFAQGERVTASATVGPKGHTARVSTTFTVARLPDYRMTVKKFTPLSNPGLVQSFVSAPDLQPPVLQVATHSAEASPGDVFLTPTHGYGQSGVMIANSSGGLVWFQAAPAGEIDTDLQTQSYEGKPVLTWWQGHVPEGLGVGFGRVEIYSSAYTPIATVSAGNGYYADLHEMQITPHGSAFITAYSLVDANLSAEGGSSNGILHDAILQEVDIKTGLVMFEWHAYGHVALGDSYTSPSSYDPGQPWDFFHINSMSLDPWGDGNFIVSSRNMWAAYEINHVNGAVMWRLGGKRPSFKMGAGTGMAWQHDVRWQPDHTLTLFDDGATPKEHSQSRAIRERINWAKRSVELIGRYVHTPPILTGSQGNDQVLPDGDSIVGWGEEPYVTEFNTAGQMLFDAHLPAPGQSYRAYRFEWNAQPAYPPALGVRTSGEATTLYTSWNGATDVSSWRILGGESPTTLAPLATSAATGFETSIQVGSDVAYYAAQALGSEGQVLGTSAATKR